MSKGETPAMWPKPGIVPGSTSPSVHHSAGISADTSSTVPSASHAYGRAHDPICSVKYQELLAVADCWRCKLIARAREDERAAALRDAIAAGENPHKDATLTGAVNITKVDTPSQQQIEHMNLAEIWDEDLMQTLAQQPRNDVPA